MPPIGWYNMGWIQSHLLGGLLSSYFHRCRIFIVEPTRPWCPQGPISFPLSLLHMPFFPLASAPPWMSGSLEISPSLSDDCQGMYCPCVPFISIGKWLGVLLLVSIKDQSHPSLPLTPVLFQSAFNAHCKSLFSTPCCSLSKLTCL